MISLNTFKKRIDELGRIVIPKEIRKFCKINSFDELELITEEDRIIITKSLGINEFKNKIKKYISLIKILTNIDLIIIENNNIVESTYNDLYGKINIDLNETFNTIKNNIIINNKNISGYIYLEKIIVDSNLLGNIIFINKECFSDINLLKNI